MCLFVAKADWLCNLGSSVAPYGHMWCKEVAQAYCLSSGFRKKFGQHYIYENLGYTCYEFVD
jgi:hypothetical protein